MIGKIILAIIIAVGVTLACFLLGAILDQLKVEIATTIGHFLETYGSVIGILTGLWFYFTNRVQPLV